MSNVLFVCVGNAGRSQMASAFLARRGGTVRSGGTRPSASPDANVVEAMAEVGIDISGRIPRAVERADLEWADLVVTIGSAGDCPVVAPAEYRDWPVADPFGLGDAETRGIRDEIRRRVDALADELGLA